jgi:inward rectifier potassium channel
MKHPRQEKSALIRAGRSSFKIKGISRFDLRDPYHVAVTLTWPQFMLALFGLYLAVNLLFAALYTASPGSLTNARSYNFLDAFFFSFETLATVGYGEMYPGSLYGHIVASAEIISGLAFTAILTGLTFVRFSRPKAKFIFADQVVVTRHNNVDTLMLRIGNGRPGVLADARVRLNVLIGEISAEGKSFRRTHELHLARQHLPILPLAWTVMHVVNEESPLYAMDEDALANGDIRLYVTMEARDPSLGAMVYDSRDYIAKDFAFGMHYADAIEPDEQGLLVLDLSRISIIEPDTASAHGNQGGLA